MENRIISTLAALVAVLSFVSTPAFANNSAAASSKSDNSAINARDQQPHEATAQDQSMKKDATETTRLIRAELTSDANLSTYAKNVKIIVIDDLITLKGPVNSEAERMKIVRTANNIAPNYKIQNQLQVTH